MIELGLQRISRLLANTPLPWRAIHVAGTNGKGSICTYISAMLEAYNSSEYRQLHRQPRISHGRFTSPHLIDRWDCISINQNVIDEKAFKVAERTVLHRNKAQSIAASEFEVLTAVAFEAFTNHDLDVGVIEVGMGGRLDATNVIGESVDSNKPATFRPPPLVTAISRIGLDHQAFLGDTIEAIATEKAGIIKSEVPVVYDSANQAEVCNVIETVARRNHSPVVRWDEIRSAGSISWCMDLMPGNETETEDYPTFITHMSKERFIANKDAAFIKSNASVAFRAVWTALQRMNRIPRLTHDNEDLKRLIMNMVHSQYQVKIPGRQETLSIKPLTGTEIDRNILLDGAHNSQSIEVLAQEVDALRRQRLRGDRLHPVTWVLAATDSKDIVEIVRPLVKSGDQVYAVEFGPVDGMPWIKPMESRKILDAVYELVPDIDRQRCYDFGDNVLHAIRSASSKSWSEPGRIIVAAGSLYLVGHIHRLLRDAQRKNNNDDDDSDSDEAQDDKENHK